MRLANVYSHPCSNGKNIFRLEVRVFPDNSCIIGAESSFDDLPAGIEYYKKHKINGVYLYEELPPPPPAPEAPVSTRNHDVTANHHNR